MARAVHDASSRGGGPFVSVNCGAIPETLVDSELFGHEKGAFTGALFQKRGRFERAHQGTIFLDEIGELPPQAQVKLLRVLQHREIERVGGVETIPLDIRIVAATNRDLEEMVRRGAFREDLWFRLNVFPIWIPPLRDRAMDIPSLVQHFLERKSKELKLRAVPTLAPGALDPLMSYPWPGNVRELENVIERAMILDPAGPLRFEYLGAVIPEGAVSAAGAEEMTETLDAVVSRHIQRVLARTGGKVNGPNGAAALLGINPSTLRNRMKKLGIPFGRKQKMGSGLEF
jgi:transcriptional regulator with GAF, ATPase, and Fis domain